MCLTRGKILASGKITINQEIWGPWDDFVTLTTVIPWAVFKWFFKLCVLWYLMFILHRLHIAKLGLRSEQNCQTLDRLARSAWLGSRLINEDTEIWKRQIFSPYKERNTTKTSWNLEHLLSLFSKAFTNHPMIECTFLRWYLRLVVWFPYLNSLPHIEQLAVSCAVPRPKRLKYFHT